MTPSIRALGVDTCLIFPFSVRGIVRRGTTLTRPGAKPTEATILCETSAAISLTWTVLGDVCFDHHGDELIAVRARGHDRGSGNAHSLRLQSGLFEFTGRNHCARALDHPAAPAQDVEPPLGVQIAAVAGVQPAVLERPVGVLRCIEVAGEDRLTPDEDLLRRLNILAGTNFVARHRLPVRDVSACVYHDLVPGKMRGDGQGCLC